MKGKPVKLLTENDTVRIRMDFSYDGTNFSGWAKQPGLRTVQSEIERALETLLRQDGIKSLTVAGRTDAGVHARNQVCHFDVEKNKLEKLLGRPKPQTVTGQSENGQREQFSARRVNGALAKFKALDIVVNSLQTVPFEFDARFSALARRYEYRMLQKSVRSDPLERHFTVAVKESLDLETMQTFSKSLLGLRDFGSFCKPREGATTIRELQEFDWRVEKENLFISNIKADAFCHSMVRTLIGASVAVGSGRVSLEKATELVQARERNGFFRVMPPHGLILQNVYYPESWEYVKRAEETRAKRSN